MKKHFTIIFIAFICLFSITANAALLDESDSFYVADYADVLSAETENNIISINGDLEYYCEGAQIVVATVEYFGDKYADEYAVQLFNDWKVAGNGMLLVVSPVEKRGGMTVGSEISDSFTSKTMNEYLDRYFWNDFDNGNYDRAVSSLMAALTDWYADQYGLVTDEIAPDDPYRNNDDGYYYPGFAYALLRMVIVVIIILFIISAMDRARYRSYYMFMGIPMPRYRFWYYFTGPHRHWRGPKGPHGLGGGGFGGPGGHSSGGHSSGSSFGNFGGFGGSSHSGSFGGHSSGGFGGFGSSGHSGGGFGGGGHSGGGFGGRR